MEKQNFLHFSMDRTPKTVVKSDPSNEVGEPMKRKILFAASSDSHILNFHLPYIRFFSEQGWQVDVVCSGSRPIPYANRVISLNFKKKMSSLQNFDTTRILRNEIKRNNYDLISTHTSLAAFFTRLALFGLKQRPLVFNTVHGYLFDDQTKWVKRQFLLKAEQLTAPYTDLLMTMNQFDYNLAIQYHLGRKVCAIPGIGVDFGRFKATPLEREQLRTSLGFDKNAFVFIYAAEFSSRKNQSDLIRAVSILPPEIKLLLPGDGQLRDECIRLAHQLHVSDRVIFPGQISEMAQWYSASDAAVSSSRSEGLPFNIMESMYVGLPVVASQVKGHSDLIQNNETGLLYPYGNVKACAAAMYLLSSTPALRSRLKQNAKGAVGSYDLHTVFPQIINLYAEFFPELAIKHPAPSVALV